MKTLLLAFLLTVVSFDLFAINASDRYRSPRNPERRIRPSTELIVLHTTEAPAKSALNKLSDRGEAHFCVTEEGEVYRIVDRDREAFHAGRSMWNGKEDCDKFSIGIEVVGYHDKPMGKVQLTALRDLVKELKSMYHLRDDQVVCHGQVAYGAPNKYFHVNHRGRKRCGMLFMMPSVRAFLNLKSKPRVDRDVQAHRLIQADPYLNSVIYGNVDTMRGKIATVESPRPSGTSSLFSWLGFGKKGDDAPRIQANTQPAPKKVAPKGAAASAPPVRKIKTPPASVAELKSRGFTPVGTISKAKTALKLAGARWNAADTYYTIRNKVFPGNTINPARIELGMTVWIRKDR